MHRRSTNSTAVSLAVALLAALLAFAIAPASATDDVTVRLDLLPETLADNPSAIPVTITAANPDGGSGANGYNGSFSLTLPVGVTLASGETPTATLPQGDGSTVLIFSNIGDTQEGSELSISVTVEAAAATWPVGSDVPLATSFATSENPRQVPDWDGTGTFIGDTDGSATANAQTTIIPIRIEKDSPTVGAENEMLRGIHDQVNTYHLEVTNNGVASTNGVTVEDFVPAELEFLGCGAVDNTDDAPTNTGSPLEYPTASPLTATPGPALVAGEFCPAPSLVESVSISSGIIASGTTTNGSPAPADVTDGVYTHVVWPIPDQGVDAVFIIEYQVGAPIRANAHDPSLNTSGTGTDDPTANLNNNSGPFTNESSGEQLAANTATVVGTFQGPVNAPGDEVASDMDTFRVSIEDLSIHKSATAPDPVVTGATASYTLLIETGEYRSVSDMTVVDTMHDGLCPLLGGANPETVSPVGTECAIASTPPSATIQSITENNDGSWDIRWNFASDASLANLAPSSSITLTYDALIRDSYQENFADAAPVNGADNFSNDVDLDGFKDIVTGIEADDNGDDGQQIFDVSDAGFGAGTASIDKSISRPSAPGAVLDCNASTWLRTNSDNSASPTAPATLSGEPYAYRIGDRVCFRLGVDLDPSLNYRNARVDDFLPPGTTFEQLWGTIPGVDPDVVDGTTASNNTVIADVTVTGPAGNQVITWDLGTQDPDTIGGPNENDLFINNDATRFEIIVSAIVTQNPAAITAPDIKSNLHKFTSSNIDGSTISLRDRADVQVVQPWLAIDKDDGGANAVVEGDVVAHTVDVTNMFNSASASTEPYDADYATAVAISVWDKLPTLLTCADISTAPTLNVPGTVAGCTDNVQGGRSVIEWTIDSLAPQASGRLSYSYIIPAGIPANEQLVNATGVRQYEGSDTNTGNPAPVFVPAANIDTTQTPNAPAIGDSENVRTPGVTVVKQQQSQHDDNDDQVVGLDTNIANASLDAALDEATIGEEVRYGITITVPAGTSVYDAVLTDALPSGLSFVSLESLTGFTHDGDTGTANPAGFTFTGGQNMSVTFPSSYSAGLNDGSGGPAVDADRVEVIVRARVDDIPSTTAGDDIVNTGSFTFRDAPSGSSQGTYPAGTTLHIVEPNPTITKEARNSGGTLVGGVAGGETITYTLTVGNPDVGGDTSNAYDLQVIDVLPAGITLATNPDGGSFTAGAFPDEGTLTWNSATTPALAVLAPGETTTVTYTVLVDEPAVASDQLTNTVDLSGTSQPGTPTDERTTYTDGDQNTLTIDNASIVKDEGPFGGPDVDQQTYAVGQPADFELSVSIPAGTRVHDATAYDTLPGGLEADSYGTPVITDCQRVSNPGLPGETLSPLGTTDILRLAPSGQQLTWFLGDVEARDSGGTPATCSIVLPYTVHVSGTAGDGDTLANSARLAWESIDSANPDPATAGELPAPGAPSWDRTDGPTVDDIDVLEPQLELDIDVTRPTAGSITGCDTTPGNDTAAGDDPDGIPTDGCDIAAGTELRYDITVDNNGTADAFDTTVLVAVETGLTPLATPGGAPATDGGTVANNAGTLTGTWNDGPHTITWSIPGPIAANTGRYSIDYNVTLDTSDTLSDAQNMTTLASIPAYYGLSAAARTAITTANPANNDIITYGDTGTRRPADPDDATVQVHFPALEITETHVAPDLDTDARLDTPFTWRITVTNSAAVASAYDIDITDTLPSGWTFVPGSSSLMTPFGPAAIGEPACSPSSGACNNAADVNSETLTWAGVLAGALQPLAPGEQLTLDFEAIPQLDAIAPDIATGTANTGYLGGAGPTHTNAASVRGADASGSASCCGATDYRDSTTDDVWVRRTDLAVTKRITPVDADSDPTNGPYWFGSFVDYSIDVDNLGPDDATDVVIDDLIDTTALTNPTIQAIEQGTFTQTAGPGGNAWGQWNIGTITSGDTLTITIRARIGTLGNIPNAAAVNTTSTYEPVTVNNTDAVTVESAPSTLGDSVWLDLDQDGLQDPGENGVPGVTVEVSYDDPLDPGTPVTQTTVTSGSGSYGFTNLPVSEPLIVTIDYTNAILNPNLDGLDPTFDLDGGLDASVVTTIDPLSDPSGSGIPGRLDVDFGFDSTPVAGGGQSLGNRVWWDQDQSGTDTDGAGEPGLVGVTVNAHWFGFNSIDDGGLGDDQVFTTDTTAGGTYLFDGIPPGRYVVTVDDADLPPGLSTPTYDLDGSATPNTVTNITLAPNENQLDVDFSYVGAGQLGDQLWIDMNGDDVLDPGEPVLPNVDVQVDWSDPVTGNSATLAIPTDGNGLYSVTGLPYGDYTITVLTADPQFPDELVPTFDADGVGTPHLSSVTLDAGSPSDLGQDFAYRGPGSIGDTVWYDENADGAADPAGTGTFDDDDQPLAGIAITVTWAGLDGTPGNADDFAFTQVTDSNGEYLVTDLPYGDYAISVNPSGLPAGLDDPTLDSDGTVTPHASATTLDAATHDDLSQDFSYTGTGRVGDFVWHDLDGNGVFDAGEPPLDAVTVRLYDASSPDPLNPVQRGEVTTDPAGNYLFDHLPAGDYFVAFAPPAFSVPTGADEGGDDSADSDGAPVSNAASAIDGWVITPTVGLGTAQSILTIDQGFYIPGSIGDQVWRDLDENGLFDGAEVGEPGVTVTLLDESDDLVGTAITDGAGNYQFNGLAPGTYLLEFTPPDDLDLTHADVGGDDSIDSDAGRRSGVTIVTVASGDSDQTLDAGLFDDASLGDIAFDDWNFNGIQDRNEPGLEDIDLMLYAPGADGVFGSTDDVLVGTTWTDENGEYSFDGLFAGDYQVVVDLTTLPDGYELTVTDAGGDDARDSDANRSDGRLTPVTLTAGEDDRDLDAGLFAPYDLSLTKALDGDLVAGQVATYVIDLHNAGPGPVRETITVVDTLPAGLTFAGVDAPSGWSCTASETAVECENTGNIPEGSTSTFIIETTVTASTGASITNEASVLGAILAAGNTSVLASVEAQVTAPSSLAFTGRSVTMLIVLGLLSVASGIAGVATSRRRRLT